MKTKLVVLSVFLLVSVVLLGFVYTLPSVDEKPKVAIRLDDVQDYWLNKVQAEVLKHFLVSKVKISLGVIPGSFGNDSLVLSVVRQGVDSGLFEVAVHGWKHENFSELSYTEQLGLISKAVASLKTTFPSTEVVTFIPPFDLINNDTVRAAEEAGIKVVSSKLENEPYFRKDRLKHLPRTVETASIRESRWVMRPIEDVQEQTKYSITRYGYAVLMIHIQQFAMYNGERMVNELDEESLNWLSQLLQRLSVNYDLVRINDLAGYVGEDKRFRS